MNKSQFTVLYVLAVALLIIAATIGCSKYNRPVQEGPTNMKTIVATVDGVPVTLEDVFNEISFNHHPSETQGNAEVELALNEAIYLKAAYLSVDDYHNYDPKVVHRLAKNRMHEHLVTYMLGDLFSKSVYVPDSSVDSAYRANILYYSFPEVRHAVHLLISDNPKAWAAEGVNVSSLTKEQIDARAKEKISGLYDEIKNGADFGELASKFSHDAQTKEQKGDLGFFKRGEMVEEFDEVVFSTSKGELSKPFKTRFGYHIVKILEINKEKVIQLDDSLRTDIHQRLMSIAESNRSLALMDSLYEVTEFEWNDTILTAERGSYDRHDWVCIVNETDSIEALVLYELEMRSPERKRGDTLSVERRKELVLGKIMPYVLSSTARQLGYADTDTMKTIYSIFYNSEIVNRMYRDRRKMDWEPDEDDLKRYYDKHIDEFMPEKPIKVQQIVFEDSVSAFKVKQEIKEGLDFEEAADKYYPGEDDVKKVAFDLGWITKDEVSSEFYNAAWIASIGKVVGPVRSPWGFHLIKVVEKKNRMTFDKAKDGIRAIFFQERRKENEKKWIKSITGGRDIDIYQDIIDEVDFKKKKYYRSVTDSLQQVAVEIEQAERGL